MKSIETEIGSTLIADMTAKRRQDVPVLILYQQLCTVLVVSLSIANAAKTSSLSNSQKLQSAIRFEMFANCGPDTNPMYAENIELRPYGRASLVGVYYDWVVTRNLPVLRRTDVVFETCREKQAPHTCVPLVTWRFGKESCAQIKRRAGVAWSKFLTFDPPLECPFQKGVYHMRNATLDFNEVSKLHFTMKGVARFRLVTFADLPSRPDSKALVETQLSCSQYELSFITIRKP